jgi:hypothetical protein
MRKDMKDLLLDTGRHGGSYGKYASSRRAELKRADPDDLPSHVSSSRRRGGGKEQGDRLNPLRQFLKKNCGRPWADVYAEICEFADSRTIRGYHLRQHVWQYVVPNNYDVGHNGRYGPFFVDDDGTLQEERKLTDAERAAERAYWRKRHKSSWEPPPPPNPRIAVDADHWYEKIEGFWFEFETKHYAFKNSYEDLVEENGEIKIVRIPLPEYTKHVTTKRQVNGKTQKALDRKIAA